MIPTPPDREPDLEIVGYLHRWALTPRNKEGNLYLHNIIQPDQPVLHDHPWAFRSIILSGGYTEMTPDGPVDHIEDDTFEKEAKDQHYIESILPNTWTLIVTGPVVRTWGFLVMGRWMSHKKYAPPLRQEVISRGGYYENDLYR